MRRLLPLLVALTLPACEAQAPVLPARLGGLRLQLEPVVVAGMPAPDAEPGPGPVGPAPGPPAPSRAPDGGSSGGGAPSPAQALAGWVLDTEEGPIPDAAVTLADGRQAKADEDGAFRLPGSVPAGPIAISAPGYATSVLYDVRGVTRFHLRRMGSDTPAYTPRTLVLQGMIEGEAHRGGVVYYFDAAVSSYQPALIESDGSYRLGVTLREGAPTNGVLLVVSGSVDGAFLYGVSRPLTLAEGREGTVVVPPIAITRPSETLAYAARLVPAGLSSRRAMLEVYQPGAPTVVLETQPGKTEGSFLAPPAKALPGELRVTVEAQSPDGWQESRLSMLPESGTARGDMLPPPRLTLAPETQQLRWDSLAPAHRVAVRSQNGAVTTWEAWREGASSLSLPPAAWPVPGQEILLEGIDAPGIGTRQVASIRALRLAPWHEAKVWRYANSRTPI